MAINIGAGFIVGSAEPIDNRIVVANQTARFALSIFTIYEGMVVYQEDIGELYAFIGDLTNRYDVGAQASIVGVEASWRRLTHDGDGGGFIPTPVGVTDGHIIVAESDGYVTEAPAYATYSANVGGADIQVQLSTITVSDTEIVFSAGSNPTTFALPETGNIFTSHLWRSAASTIITIEDQDERDAVANAFGLDTTLTTAQTSLHAVEFHYDGILSLIPLGQTITLSVDASSRFEFTIATNEFDFDGANPPAESAIEFYRVAADTQVLTTSLSALTDTLIDNTHDINQFALDQTRQATYIHDQNQLNIFIRVKTSINGVVTDPDTGYNVPTGAYVSFESEDARALNSREGAHAQVSFHPDAYSGGVALRNITPDLLAYFRTISALNFPASFTDGQSFSFDQSDLAADIFQITLEGQIGDIIQRESIDGQEVFHSTHRPTFEYPVGDNEVATKEYVDRLSDSRTLVAYRYFSAAPSDTFVIPDGVYNWDTRTFTQPAGWYKTISAAADAIRLNNTTVYRLDGSAGGLGLTINTDGTVNTNALDSGSGVTEILGDVGASHRQAYSSGAELVRDVTGGVETAVLTFRWNPGDVFHNTSLTHGMLVSWWVTDRSGNDPVRFTGEVIDFVPNSANGYITVGLLGTGRAELTHGYYSDLVTLSGDPLAATFHAGTDTPTIEELNKAFMDRILSEAYRPHDDDGNSRPEGYGDARTANFMSWTAGNSIYTSNDNGTTVDTTAADALAHPSPQVGNNDYRSKIIGVVFGAPHDVAAVSNADLYISQHQLDPLSEAPDIAAGVTSTGVSFEGPFLASTYAVAGDALHIPYVTAHDRDQTAVGDSDLIDISTGSATGATELRFTTQEYVDDTRASRSLDNITIQGEIDLMRKGGYINAYITGTILSEFDLTVTGLLDNQAGGSFVAKTTLSPAAQDPAVEDSIVTTFEEYTNILGFSETWYVLAGVKAQAADDKNNEQVYTLVASPDNEVWTIFNPLQLDGTGFFNNALHSFQDENTGLSIESVDIRTIRVDDRFFFTV